VALSKPQQERSLRWSEPLGSATQLLGRQGVVVRIPCPRSIVYVELWLWR